MENLWWEEMLRAGVATDPEEGSQSWMVWNEIQVVEKLHHLNKRPEGNTGMPLVNRGLPGVNRGLPKGLTQVYRGVNPGLPVVNRGLPGVNPSLPGVSRGLPGEYAEVYGG